MSLYKWEVFNQTSRLEIQSLESALSSNKLENKLLWQTSEINQLWDKTGYFSLTLLFYFVIFFCFLVTVKCNSVLFMSVSVFSTLEQRILNMEARHHAELGWIKGERTELQRLLASQSSSIQSLELNLEQVVTNNSALYREQLQMYSTINDLLKLCSKKKGTQIGETNCVLRMTFRGNVIFRICSHNCSLVLN